MREMKDSGYDWLGMVPKNWSLKRGRFLFFQRNEKGNSVNLELLSPSQKFGVIPQRLLEEWTTHKAVKLKENTDLSELKTVHKGDFCISLRSFQGGFEYSEYEGVVSPAYQIFHKNIDLVEGYYRYLFKDFSFIDKMNSYTMSLRDGKNIAFFDFGNTYLPFPPLSEQQRIAFYLDSKCSKIDDIIEKQQSVIEKLKSYKQSIITEAVTKGLNPDVPMKDSGVEWIGEVPREWKVCKVGYFTKKIGSGKTPKGGAEIYSKKGILFLRSQNIYDTGLKLDDATYISEAIDLEMSATRVLKDDILLNITGGSIGRCCIYPFEETANVNQHVCIIRVNQNIISPQFMHYLWVSNIGKISIDICQTGSNREGMNFNQISKTFFPLPFVDEQKEICDYLDQKCSAIDSTIANKQALIEKLTAYKKSLIYEVVTGKKEV